MEGNPSRPWQGLGRSGWQEQEQEAGRPAKSREAAVGMTGSLFLRLSCSLLFGTDPGHQRGRSFALFFFSFCFCFFFVIIVTKISFENIGFSHPQYSCSKGPCHSKYFGV